MDAAIFKRLFSKTLAEKRKGTYILPMVRFRALSVPVSVHWSFWLSALVFAGLGDLTLTGKWETYLARIPALFVALFAHEAGHALMMLHYNGRPRVHLYSLGGLTTCPGHFTRGPAFLITLAGPLSGLALYVFMGWIPLPEASPPLLREFWSELRTVSLWWSLLNFLPILPLDGGQLFESLLGRHQRQIVGFTGVAVAVLCFVLSLYLLRGSLFAPLLFGCLAVLNYQHAQGERVAGSPVSIH